MQRVMRTPYRPYDQTALFRPPLDYPTHPYDEILTRTARRYPEHTTHPPHLQVGVSRRTVDP